MSRQSILIVDDDIDIREILAETLTEKGFDVATAANGVDALKILRGPSVRPSVILLDLMMPIMDGYGFLEQRSMDPALAAIPLAIATAGCDLDYSRLGGERAIVAKPFDVPQLVGVLHKLGAAGSPSR